MDIFAPLSLFLIATDLNLKRGDKRQSAGFLKSIGLHQLSPNWIRFFIRHNLGLLIALHPGSGRRALQAITSGAHWTVDIGQSWRSPGCCYGSNQITVHLVWDESPTQGRMGLLRDEEWTGIGSRMEGMRNRDRSHGTNQVHQSIHAIVIDRAVCWSWHFFYLPCKHEWCLQSPHSPL